MSSLEEFQAKKSTKEIPERVDKLQNIPVLALFLFCLLFVLIFSIYAFPTCSPWRSFYGSDSWGNICSSLYQTTNVVSGVTGSGKIIFGKDKVWALNFYTTSTQCLDKSFSENLVKICVESCPTINLEVNPYSGCMTILDENDYGGNEYAYAHKKCQMLNDTRAICLNGAQEDSE